MLKLERLYGTQLGMILTIPTVSSLDARVCHVVVAVDHSIARVIATVIQAFATGVDLAIACPTCL